MRVPAAEPPIAAIDGPGHRFRVVAWVLYDLANTVYYAIVTYVLVRYATNELGMSQTAIGATQSASMITAAALVPTLGALGDQTARAGRYLTIATLLCVVATAGFALRDRVGDAVATLVVCFFVANLTYNLALVFYNTLLASVAKSGDEGRISGLGVGIGYAGNLVVIGGLVMPEFAPETTFVAAAAVFLVIALPCLVLVKDRRAGCSGGMLEAIRAANRETIATLRDLPRHPALAWFLLGNFCLVDVINTAILFFAKFTEQNFAAAIEAGTCELPGMQFRGPDGATSLVVVLGLFFSGLALPIGIAIGRWTDRAPLQVMNASALALLVALAGGAWFGGTSVLGYLLTLVAFGSFGLSAAWTAGRKVVLLLAPRDRVGQYFGLYGITLKLSVVGGFVYGFVADRHGAKAAMLVQGIPLLIALACLAMVRLPKTASAPTA